MNKLIFPIILILSLTFAGCSLFSGSSKTTKTEAKGRARIVNVEGQINANTTEKLTAVSELSYGVNYALGKVNDPPKEVVVAIDLNNRVSSLSGSPTLDKMKEMQETIDKLISTLASERNEGKVRLEEKDNEISNLQAETKELLSIRDSEIKKYMFNAQEAAQELQEYKGWLGLKAVWKGMWQFISSVAWILGGLGIIFLILRLGAMSNPICGAIFSVFEQIVAWVINAVKVVFPKALQFAGNVSKEVYTASHNLLEKIVDNIEQLKQIEKSNGKPITVKELLVELDKTMDVSDKEMIAAIKKDFGY